MKKSVVLAIDQATTGTRAVLYNQRGKFLNSSYREFRQYYPSTGWVEHDPQEIWHSVLKVISDALTRGRIHPSQIASMGITNQRETTVLWDRKTGRPVHPAIVWQDRRTASFCEQLKKRGMENTVRNKTGLVMDPYFSGTKIHWLLEHVPGLKRKARKGQILFGTIDTWLIWKLTGGRVHVTDLTNASRTLLLCIRKRRWDDELLRMFKIPPSILPQVQESGSYFGETVSQGCLRQGIPIYAVMGDQQAALYGQGCDRAGEAKNTYGTGCFAVLNIGRRPQKVPFGLLGTLACDENGKPVYALEGSIFITGAAVQWLRDGLGFFRHAGETETLAKNVEDTSGVVVIPALVGLGSPYWNPHVRSMITGLTRGTRREHIVRAVLESIAQQTADVLEIMQRDSGYAIKELKVDGGATANRFLMQFQADLLGVPILVSDIAESTAWGVAKLSARMAGFWSDLKAIDRRRKYLRFLPRSSVSQRQVLREQWKREIRRLLMIP
ncbi:MAG: glycerol kinase GlpK [Candidatus Omnitrophica bacterium]|nr:glycerol kinase GlpK [Candidatus Omnitrophota bacterium]